ncbi:MAG: serine--tRNA ligase, partial [Pseudomonadota bacterium]
MFDLRWLRENPDAFDHAMQRRGIPPASSALLALDQERRDTETELQQLQQRRNELSRQIGEAKRKGGNEAEALLSEVGSLKEATKAGEDRLRELQQAFDRELSGFPNVLAEEVPEGADELANVELRKVGTPRQFDFSPLDHDDVGLPHGLRLELGAKLSGSRFAVLRSNVARLQRALGQFMLDMQIQEHGYSEVDVPY